MSKKQEHTSKDKDACLTAFNRLAHDLRTSLLSVSLRSSFMKKIMPELLKAYTMAKNAGLDLPEIPAKKLKEFEESPDNIVEVIKEANELVDTFLGALKSLKTCYKEADQEADDAFEISTLNGIEENDMR